MWQWLLVFRFTLGLFPSGLRALLVSAVCIWGVTSGSAMAGFDPTGWKLVRDVEVPERYANSLVGIALESGVLEHCRPDRGDLRIVSSDGAVVPITITPVTDGGDQALIPTRVYRVGRKAGKWTDIWVDKSAKVLTRGIAILTGSSEFIRPVEIRGADNSQQAYVIRVDGLIVDRKQPPPVQCKHVFHPLNNHQYLQIRILDGDAPPLKIDGVACYPPLFEMSKGKPISLRILENRVDKDSAATILVADLGLEHLPLSHISVDTTVAEFVKSMKVFGGATASPNSWTKLGEETIFRIKQGNASAENLEILLQPTNFRYIKLEFSGGNDRGFTVDGLGASGSLQLMVFQARQGLKYKLYYDNPSATSVHLPGEPVSFNVARLAATTEDIKLGKPRKNLLPPRAKPVKEQKNMVPLLFGKVIGVIMLLVGLLLLFGVMLKARSLRRREKQRNSRIYNTPP
jgi:hypothetical protein